MKLILGGARPYYGWVVVGSVFMVLFFSAGTRFSFGAFYDTLLHEFGWSRAALAGAASLNMVLAGVVRPIIGFLVDRTSCKRVMILGLGLAAVSLVLLSFATELWHFYVLFSVMSVGYSAASPSTTVPLISRWFLRQRSTAQSVGNAGTPLGELLIVPIMTAVLLLSSWQVGYRILAAMVVLIVIPIVVVLVKDDPDDLGLRPLGARNVSHGGHHGDDDGLPLAQALRSLLFWQLGFGFFVCGFTMTFAATHFMAFADDLGVEKMTASVALGLVGGVSIFGTIVLGYLGDRYPTKDVLAVTYLLRGLAFFVLWQTHGIDLLFLGSFLLGLSFASTVPLTSTCLADAYGRRHIGSIFGMLFAIMPVGSGAGAYLAGWVFDVMGSYHPALLLDALLGGLAAATVYLVRPIRRVPEPLAAGATG